MKKYFVKFLFILSIIFLLCAPANSYALSDWQINNFDSQIELQKDSSAIITEKITADCDSLPGKHGIFRVLPTRLKTNDGKVTQTPVTLISITDFNDKPLIYSESKDPIEGTVTWQIGDPNKEVQGVNYYKIKYKIQNIIHSIGSGKDELYLNLSGNFWQININNFTAQIIFPDGINQANTQISYYAGAIGSKNTDLATYKWTSDNTLEFDSSGVIYPGEGITASVSFPSGIFTYYSPSLWNKITDYLLLFLPLIILLFSLFVWSKYGKDPKINPTVVPEFEVPNKFSPIKLGLVFNDGIYNRSMLAAQIVYLATKGYIKIEKIKKSWALGSDSFKLIKVDNTKMQIDNRDKEMIDVIFGSYKEAELSDLGAKYPEIMRVVNNIKDDLYQEKLIIARSRILQFIWIFLGLGSVAYAVYLFLIYSTLQTVALLVTALIFFIFSYLLKQRTLEGAQFNQKIKGFKLYMMTAEKYRQKFNEKENIFERFLPYAILFGITKIWIKKIQQIYGERYFNTYAPIWLIGIDARSFNPEVFDSVANSISANVGQSSGAGGMGGAGGGFGGGGGGGW